MITLHDSPTTTPRPARAPHAIIGLSTSEMREPTRVYHDPHGEPPQRELALGLAYPQAIRRAGAVPIVIPPLDVDSIEPLLDGLCGLCLSGGPDLHPSVYGAEPHPLLGPTEPHLDSFEIALVRAAEARELPVLAICRGLQVLNVSRGGTLVQDLPSERPSDVEHRQAEVGWMPTHDVRLQPGSLVADCLGETEARVNSFHHQAVDRLGDGLRIVGWAPDGTVEAVEATDRRFTVAVQWHAESMVRSPEQERLLSSFARAASRAARAGVVRAA
ncbi:MAG: gamma-glutamyl-gamma-aminobutyrate hydrolase family protein [Solirubrobacteraceae bacterium]|nr:gamma-glutamyl-gamma-aminobutyrate hydrolase family protein [Solirubrobacteraceae bacterium]